MPWPIPELPAPVRPKAIDWRVWLIVFFAVMGLGAATVLFFWSKERSTQTLMFWAVLLGLPLCLFAILFGRTLNQWEEAQLLYEEQDRENARLTDSWHRWANRNVEVIFATTFLAGIDKTEGWESPDAEFPVNLQRARGLAWLSTSQGEKRAESILELLNDRLSARLAAVRELKVVLLLDQESLKDETWEAAVRQALATERRRVTIEMMDASTSVSWLQEWIDAGRAVTTLLIAFQLWHGAKERPYSEGGAAILIRAKAPPDPLRLAKVGVHGPKILRPVVSTVDDLKEDFRQLLNMQLGSKKAASFWMCGLRDDARSMLQVEAGNHPVTSTTIVRNLDAALGHVGPASSWIALAIALESGLRCGLPQLLAVNDDGNQILTCAVM